MPGSRNLPDSNRYSLGLTPYEWALKKEGIVDKKSILDVGCGPGMWTLAAARLNPRAFIIGTDINEEKLVAANRYSEKYSLRNCCFQHISYKELPMHFEKESFDVIICNSVLQYIDEKKVITIFSNLLKENGTLLMYYNHSYGYFIDKLLLGLIKRDLRAVVGNFRVLLYNILVIRRNGEPPSSHPITLGSLKKITSEVGIILTHIDNGSNDYLSKIEVNHSKKVKSDHKFYLGIPYVVSCKGVKQAV